MSDDNLQEGRVAAAWWGAAISRIGSGSAGAVDIDLLRTLTAPAPLGEDARRRFEEHLAAWIDARLDKGHRVRMGVDYAPDGPDGGALVSALGAANVLAAPWPLKTRMWIERGSVVVRGGYGASYERLLGAPVEGVSGPRGPEPDPDMAKPASGGCWGCNPSGKRTTWPKDMIAPLADDI